MAMNGNQLILEKEFLTRQAEEEGLQQFAVIDKEMRSHVEACHKIIVPLCKEILESVKEEQTTSPIQKFGQRCIQHIVTSHESGKGEMNTIFTLMDAMGVADSLQVWKALEVYK